MNSNIQIIEMLYRIFLELILIPPEFISQNDLAELRAPIAKMIYANDLITSIFKNSFQRRPDNR
jgi:hypothetical protein